MVESPRRDVYRWGAITAVGVVAGYVAVLLANARHFYTDDTESQYTPLWVMLGRYLREGHLPVLIPEQWMTGNYTMEEAGLFNPPQLLIDLIAPSVDNLAVYATIVKLIFAIIAALGVYRVCLAYGGRVQWAAVAGIAFPLTGWFLFFDQASWVTSLTGTAWMVHAWASSVRYARGKGGPIPVFVFLYLAISVEYVFPAVESALMLVAVAVGELVHQRKWQPIVRLAVVAGFAGLAGLMTYLPSMLSAKVSWRGTSQINNDQFLTVPWSESLNASLPSTLPAFNSWWGYIQPLPMTYIAWFLIPALAFVDWGKARAAWRELTAVALFATMFLMWTAGPGTVGPLRWPARVLPMLALGLLVLVCVLLGRFGTFSNWRSRGIAGLVLIGLLWVRTFSADPHDVVWHLLSAVVVAALGAGVIWLGRTRGTAAAVVLTIVAMFPIAYAQVRGAQPNPMSWNLPTNRSEAKAAFPKFDGLTIQLGDRGLLQPNERTLQGAYGSLVFGNYAKDLNLHYVNGYTPNGHYWFGEMLCMRWDSSVCPDAFRRLFTPEATTGRAPVDLMKLDRVVLQRAMFPEAGDHPAPEGWKWVDYPGHERYIRVLEREGGPISGVNGRVADVSGVTADSISESDTTSRVRVSSAEGGRVVFARLGWPGYRVTLNGKPIDFTTVAKSFVAVNIPAGTDNAVLDVSWRPPGWKIGIASAIAGLLGLGIMQWLYIRSRRRRDDPSPTEATGESERELAEAVS
ncbi:hypothetical protein [Nocardia pseudobrasiliensis]|uniref:YfhO family protein n=1 Tax=Nocardia pseudobrasiliensis TaxID=45979 RepID=A0A370I4Q6_9NOCA|nr:hypothetical protein [Nocardia pseudobrasiliensis]RDI65675.1 hypothetical protein DFR76_106547 [Nocardia pseudobrasiliensis]